MRTGRPRLSRGYAKSVQVGVRFTKREAEALKKEAKRTGFTVSGLVRDIAMSEARYLLGIQRRVKELTAYKIYYKKGR